MELRDAIYGRRSVRKYTDQPISGEDLQYILDCGVMAPSGLNMQPWYFAVVRSEDKLRECYRLMEKVYDSFRPNLEKRFGERHPEVIAQTKTFFETLGGAQVCGYAFCRTPEISPSIPILSGISAALENMLLAAWDRGIASCWLTAILTAGIEDEVHRLFAPEAGKLVGMFTLGYPAESPPVPPRREGRYQIL